MESDPIIGTRVGNYQIVSLLGEGGMARVYRATHPEIGSQVAMKVLNAQVSAMPDVVKRFRIEAQAVNKIEHPNIIKIFDFGNLPDGRQYYLMEMLSGESLADHIRRVGAMSLGETLRVIDAVLDALDAVHATNVVHRDLKPDNVFLSRGGVKLLDFGIVKLLDETGFDKTRTGALLGTPSYMAPEQCEGRQRDIGPKTDLYAVGCMLYQMLSGTLPFDADSLGGLLLQHMTQTPPALRERMANVPPAISDLVASCLAKDPQYRPASASAMREALRPYLGGGQAPTMATVAPAHAAQTIAAPPRAAAPAPTPAPAPNATLPMESLPKPREPAPPARSRWPYLIAGVAVAGIAAVAAIVVATRGGTQPPPPPATPEAGRPLDAPPPRPDDAAPPPADAAAPVDAPCYPLDQIPKTLTERLKRLNCMCKEMDLSANECAKRKQEILTEFGANKEP